MEKNTFVASCPICGRVLFKGTPNSYMEGGCPKCGEYLKVAFVDTGFSVTSGKEYREGKGNKSTPVV